MNYVHNQVPAAAAVDTARAWQQLSRDSRFALHEPEAIAQKLRDAVKAGTRLDSSVFDSMLGDVNAASDQVSKFFNNPKAAPASLDRKVRKTEQIPVKPATIRPTTSGEGFLSHMNPVAKVGLGLTALMASFSAISMIDAFGKIKKPDEHGESQLQVSQVLLTGLYGLITFGLAAAAHHQYNVAR